MLAGILKKKKEKKNNGRDVIFWTLSVVIGTIVDWESLGLSRLGPEPSLALSGLNLLRGGTVGGQ